MSEPQRPHILIVDDEAANMNALRDTLSTQGYDVTGFTDAGAALENFHEGVFDLLLADLVMPQMGGVELLREAQRRDPDLVGVIMTGDGTIATAVEAMKTGALDYILKPLKLSIVLPVLARALTVRRLRIENAALERSVRERTIALEAALNEAKMQMAERIKAEQALNQAQKLDALGKLAGGIAHDFNNLLTVIIGGLDMIRNKPADSDRVIRLADQGIIAATRCAELTTQMLMFARRQTLRPQSIDLNQLIRDSEAQIQSAVGPNIGLKVQLDPDLQPVWVDRQQFEAALMNLVTNARDAIPDKGEIRIETRNVISGSAGAADQPDASIDYQVTVSLSDDGSGIAPDLLPLVFDPFFTTKAVGRGTGLGLSQVYGFIKESGGHIGIRSGLGDGTTVTLYLPRLKQPGIEQGRQAIATAAAPTRQGETILVVEDTRAVLAMTVECLDGLGYNVLAATNAADALDLLKANQRIDILFSDVVMPGAMNGVQLASEVRRLRPAVKVLLTSGYTADALSAQHGLEEGMPLLPKPYLPGQLARQLASLAPPARLS
jgi:signal transduction histidine kinase